MSFTLKILGSGSATPAHGRFPSAQLLRAGQEHFLIDCGEGTQFQLLRYRCKASHIGHILISHLHGDHYYGLPGLLSTLSLNGRTEPLHLYGPPPLCDVLTAQFRASGTWLNYPLHFHPLEPVPGVFLETDHLAVSAVPLHHGIACTGFVFREKPGNRRLNKELLPGGLSPHQLKRLKEGKDLHDADGALTHRNEALTLPPRPPRSYAYLSDTAPHAPALPHIAGVDLLYHEATFLDADAARAAATLHSTARQAAGTALQAGAGRLLIGHFSARYKDLSPFLDEARSLFPATDLASEGLDFGWNDQEALSAGGRNG